MSEIPSSATLRVLVPLIARREKIIAELESIESQILQVQTDAPSSRAGRRPGSKKTMVSAGTGKRGALKEQILAILHKAGKNGIAAKDIAAQLQISPGRVHVWFATTGKKSGMIEALGKGRHRLKS